MTDRTILVVDDDAESLGFLTGILSAEGYQVRPANSGQLALASLAVQRPQLILLDIRMPGMDGFEVCRRLKASENNREVPLMFISAAEDLDERLEGLALGAVDFVSKPFQREELLARVRTHMELGRLRAGLEEQVARQTADLRLAVECLQNEVEDRKRVEEELRESEARFRNMADTAPMMICASGPDKLATFFNKIWLTFTGHTMEQELGYGWTANVHPADLDASLASYSASFDARRECHIEYRLRRADGEYRWVVCHGVPRFQLDGVFSGYTAACMDFTELKLVQEDALARNKLESVGVLAGGIAHDFNNLLGSIIAESELVLADLPEDSSAREGIESIKGVADRASEIVRQLMAYVGLENASLEALDISVLVGEMLHLLRLSISKHATLNVEIAESASFVRANAAQIRQVVMNLITNASESLGEKDGIITVRTAKVTASPQNLPAGDYFMLEVSDTGCGMTEEVQARIFDPFFTTKFTGRGLGLAAVQGIIRDHGGAITFTSGPGQGTRFQVLLPCIDQPQSHPEIMEHASPAGIGPTSGSVLIVEDEDTLRLAVSRMLRKAGFSVIEAGDGLAAVGLFGKNRRDIGVVLLDMTLPGMCGLDVFAELCAMRPDVKVVLTSAYSRETAAPAYEAPQIRGFIRKPYQFRDLAQLLRVTLSS